jgi:hypothetical protein
LQRGGERGDENRKPGADETVDEKRPSLFAKQFLEGGVGEIGNCNADDAHVEDVGSQRQQTAILEDKRLNADNGGHDDNRRPWTEQDGGDCRAHQVSRRAACDGEVEHLPGEDCSRQNAHQRNLTFAEVLSHAAECVANWGDG